MAILTRPGNCALANKVAKLCGQTPHDLSIHGPRSWRRRRRIYWMTVAFMFGRRLIKISQTQYRIVR